VFSYQITGQGRNWTAIAPMLDLLATATTKAAALEALCRAIETAIDRSGAVVTLGDSTIDCTVSALLIGLCLRRFRAASGQSLAQVSDKMGYKSRNQYARYERGEAVPAVDTFFALLRAVAPDNRFVIAAEKIKLAV
jgi:hypothetical protein